MQLMQSNAITMPLDPITLIDTLQVVLMPQPVGFQLYHLRVELTQDSRPEVLREVHRVTYQRYANLAREMLNMKFRVLLVVLLSACSSPRTNDLKITERNGVCYFNVGQLENLSPNTLVALDAIDYQSILMSLREADVNLNFNSVANPLKCNVNGDGSQKINVSIPIKSKEVWGLQLNLFFHQNKLDAVEVFSIPIK